MNAATEESPGYIKVKSRDDQPLERNARSGPNEWDRLTCNSPDLP